MPLVRSRLKPLSIALTLALCAFVLATTPGSSIRTVVFEREAPPLPKEIGRDAAVDVDVHAQGTVAAIPSARDRIPKRRAGQTSSDTQPVPT